MKAQDERARAAKVLGDALATALCPRVPATGGSLSDRLFQLLSAELDATRARVGGCEVSVGASVIYFGLNSGGGRRLQSGSSRAGGLYLEFSLESSADVGTSGDPTAPLRDLAAFGDALAAAAAEASQSSWPSSAAPLAGDELAEVLVGDEWRTSVKASMLVRAASPSAAAALPSLAAAWESGEGAALVMKVLRGEGAAAAVAAVTASAERRRRRHRRRRRRRRPHRRRRRRRRHRRRPPCLHCPFATIKPCPSRATTVAPARSFQRVQPASASGRCSASTLS